MIKKISSIWPENEKEKHHIDKAYKDKSLFFSSAC